MGEVDGQFHFCRATWGHLSLAELMSCQCRRGCGCGQGCGCRPGCGCSWGCGCGRGCGCSQRRAGRGTDGSPPPSCPPAGASHKLVPGSAWRSRVRGPAVGNGLGGRGHLLSRGDTDAIASPPPTPEAVSLRTSIPKSLLSFRAVCFSEISLILVNATLSPLTSDLYFALGGRVRCPGREATGTANPG